MLGNEHDVAMLDPLSSLTVTTVIPA